MIKNLTIALLFATLLAIVLVDWELLRGPSFQTPNRAGGMISFSNQNCANSKWMQGSNSAHTTMRSGNTQLGCWVKSGKNIMVKWSDGDVYIYPISSLQVLDDQGHIIQEPATIPTAVGKWSDSLTIKAKTQLGGPTDYPAAAPAAVPSLGNEGSTLAPPSQAFDRTDSPDGKHPVFWDLVKFFAEYPETKTSAEQKNR